MKKIREINWFDVSRLLGGTAGQQSAASTLLKLGIFDLLEEYTPVLCGTVPIDCDLPGSDLDIICHAPRPIPFEETVRMHFGDTLRFRCRRKRLVGIPSVVARFHASGWKIEIVGQAVPVLQQRAFAHMVAEALLLSGAGPETNTNIRDLKRGGKTTEEAFGKIFSLPGNPYDALMQIYESEVLREGTS